MRIPRQRGGWSAPHAHHRRRGGMPIAVTNSSISCTRAQYVSQLATYWDKTIQIVNNNTSTTRSRDIK